MTDKLQEYKERQKDWRDISISQLATANNILLTLASGLIVFCIDKKKVNASIHFDFTQTINWQLLTYWISILLLGLSIFYGLCVLLIRLYDFRITRHISLTRQRFYKVNQENANKELPYTDFGKFKIKDRIKAIFKITFCELPFINPEDAKKINGNDNLLKNFQYLRKTADILGTTTWIWTKIQILLFLVSGIIYLIHQLTL